MSAKAHCWKRQRAVCGIIQDQAFTYILLRAVEMPNPKLEYVSLLTLCRNPKHTLKIHILKTLAKTYKTTTYNGYQYFVNWKHILGENFKISCVYIVSSSIHFPQYRDFRYPQFSRALPPVSQDERRHRWLLSLYHSAILPPTPTPTLTYTQTHKHWSKTEYIV